APLPKMTDEAAAAIEAFLTPELRHNGGEHGLKDLGWAGELTAAGVAWFEAAATGPAPPTAALEEAAAELARRAGERGPRVSPVTRDLDAARAELTELRQQIVFEHGEARRLAAELDALKGECVEAIERLDAALADG